MEIEGASAVVTGGASGIGEAVALGCAAAGAHAVCLDVDADGSASFEGLTGSGQFALLLADVGDGPAGATLGQPLAVHAPRPAICAPASLAKHSLI